MITFLQLGRYGRFANQLFQIASTIGIAIRSGQDYAFPDFTNHDHRERFGSSEDVDLGKYFIKQLPKVTLDIFFESRFIQWGYHDVYLPVGNWDLQGHMQSERYFSHCIDIVREYFTFHDEFKQNNKVAIHWRAGDYQEGGEEVYHPRQVRKYYEHAMTEFPKGTEFIVFSDDKEGFAKMMEGYEFEYSNQPDYIQDFKLMKSCKSFIIANSTYSLMAAILANHPEKKIVCPKLWFGKVAGITGDDCYPQEAVVI